MNAECSSLNIISTLPQTIIENILCLLPIEEAARTSILSKEWRYKWTTIPKLQFSGLSFCFPRNTKEKLPFDIASARKNMDPRCKFSNAIHHVLLMRQGPIHEFTFSSFRSFSCFELDPIIFHLSRNHAVKKLRLECNGGGLYKLPLCAFSLHQLTDLDLKYVEIDHQPIFSGFGSLRSLCLYYVGVTAEGLLHLLSNCPSLKRLSMLLEFIDKVGTIIELFECLPVIEHLTIYGYNLRWLLPDSVPEELSTSLIHLKYFCFKEMSLDDNHHLTFLAILIKYSPNLEKIKLEAGFVQDDMYSGALEKYSDVWLGHLKELEITCFDNSKASMEFLKFILARSPKLKKVWLHCVCVDMDEELEMLKALLKAPRASPVEIVVI